MINTQLLSYVRQQLSLNIGRETITANLKGAGWTDADLNEAFTAVGLIGSNPTIIPISPMVSGVISHGVEAQVKTIHPKSKRMILFVSIFILFIVAGGGAYVYYSNTSVPLSNVSTKVIEDNQTEKSVTDTSVEDALRELDEARQKEKEYSIKARISNLRAWAELFWDENNGNGYSGFCLSKESKDAQKSIEDNGGTGFVCRTTLKSYAIGVKLSQYSENWCVDSVGANKSTATLPSGTVCPVK